MACVGWLIVRHREAVIKWWVATTGASVGLFLGRAFVALGGYVWLLVSTLGILLWFVDALA